MTLYEKFKQASKEEMAEMLAVLVASSLGTRDPITFRSVYRTILANLGEEIA